MRGSRPQHYRRREELSCTAQFISPNSLLRSVTTSQRRDRRPHCAPRKDDLCLETSGVGNECLPAAAPDIWREYGVSAERTVSYHYHYGLFLVKWWHGFGVRLNRNGHPEFKTFCDNILWSSSYVRVLRRHQESTGERLLFFWPIYKGEKKAASGLDQNVIAITPDASRLEKEYACFLWGGMLEEGIYLLWGWSFIWRDPMKKSNPTSLLSQMGAGCWPDLLG